MLLQSLPLLGSMSNSSFVLINGGYEPVITMQASEKQHVRSMRASQ